MRVFFQRGSTSSARGYQNDLKNTVLKPISSAAAVSIVRTLRDGGYTHEADHVQGLLEPRFWGGPAGIRRVFEQMSSGDLCLFILNDEFVAASRVGRPIVVDGDSALRVARAMWERLDYPHIWSLDRVFPTDKVWRRDLGEELTGDRRFFVQGTAALFPQQFINIQSVSEEWLKEHDSGVVELLRRLGLSADYVDRLLA